MIGAKLSDQRNSRNVGRFKSTNQRFAYSGSPPRFSRLSNPPEGAKRWLVDLKRPASSSIGGADFAMLSKVARRELMQLDSALE